MKMRIKTIRVDTYKSGDGAGEYRAFNLPDGAIVLDTHVTVRRDYDDRTMTITYAVAA